MIKNIWWTIWSRRWHPRSRLTPSKKIKRSRLFFQMFDRKTIQQYAYLSIKSTYLVLCKLEKYSLRSEITVGDLVQIFTDTYFRSEGVFNKRCTCWEIVFPLSQGKQICCSSIGFETWWRYGARWKGHQGEAGEKKSLGLALVSIV
jgi:hypothetical protein